MKLITFLSLLALTTAAPKLSKLGFRSLYQKPEVVASKLEPHIITGHEAIPHSFPYQAYIQVLDIITSVYWYCGGVLISPNYVLTTGHCVIDQNHLFTIILGAHKPSEDESTQMVSSGMYLKIHENYTKSDILNDIAIMRLSQTVRFTDAIQTVILPSDPSNSFAGSLATVSGWGVTAEGSSQASEVLNYLTQSVITNQDCERYFGPLDSTILCTAPEDRAGICAGDAGSPLVTEGVLIGLVAFTAEKCTGSPIGFTRIASFVDWIKDSTNDLS